jgi:hypothetical protein
VIEQRKVEQLQQDSSNVDLMDRDDVMQQLHVAMDQKVMESLNVV